MWYLWRKFFDQSQFERARTKPPEWFLEKSLPLYVVHQDVQDSIGFQRLLEETCQTVPVPIMWEKFLGTSGVGATQSDT